MDGDRAMKNFLIIGNKNAITYKEIFPLIKENKMWLGVTSPKDFIQPEGNEKKNMVGLTRWFTNIEHSKRNQPLYLYKRYNAEKYPRYDNYNGINVDKVKDIPIDYDGVIGVPITFLDKYCPSQFAIIGCSYQYGDCGKHIDGKGWGVSINGKDIYKRLFIKQFEIVGLTSSSKDNTYGQLIGNSTTRAMVNNKKIYARILIRTKK